MTRGAGGSRQGRNLRHVFRSVTAESRSCEHDVEAADRAVERYLANERIIEVIAAAERIPVVFVWQPAPTYRYDPRHHVTRDLGRHALSGVG